MSSLKQPIQLCGTTLGEYRHICAFFRNTSEEYDVLIPFMREGLERGQKAVYIGDPKLHQERLGMLSALGAGVVMDTLRSHPMVILGGVIQVNPFYVPPDEFLRELTERDARSRFA